MSEQTYTVLAKKYEEAGYLAIADVLRRLEAESATNPDVQLVVPFDESIFALPPAPYVQIRDGKQCLVFRLDWLAEIQSEIKADDHAFVIINSIATVAMSDLAQRDAEDGPRLVSIEEIEANRARKKGQIH